MKRPLKIIHAADLHLDSPLEALGDKAASRRREQREMLLDLAELCRERDVDMLLLAGDLLDSGSAYAETIAALRAAFEKLDCPVFISPGNHDFFAPGSPYARSVLPENVCIFRGGWECVELNELGARVWGAGYTDAVCPPLLRGFSVEKRSGIIDIGLLHGELGAPEDGRYCPISPADVAASGFDYLALGHKHTYSGLMRFGASVCAYPGCPEGRGFDECGDKGVLYLELDGESVREEFIPIARRRYEIIELDISAGIPEPPPGFREDIVRVVFTGECDRAPELGEIQRSWESRFYALQLRDRSHPRRDMWEDSARDSLKGLFLRKMRAKYDSAANEAEREKITQALRWGLAALEGGEAVSDL